MSYNSMYGSTRPAIERARDNVKMAVEARFDVDSVVGAAKYITAFEAGARSRDTEVALLKAEIERLDRNNETYQRKALNDAAELAAAHADVHAALCEMIARGVRFRVTPAAGEAP